MTSNSSGNPSPAPAHELTSNETDREPVGVAEALGSITTGAYLSDGGGIEQNKDQFVMTKGIPSFPAAFSLRAEMFRAASETVTPAKPEKAPGR